MPSHGIRQCTRCSKIHSASPTSNSDFRSHNCARFRSCNRCITRTSINSERSSHHSTLPANRAAAYTWSCNTHRTTREHFSNNSLPLQLPPRHRNIKSRPSIIQHLFLDSKAVQARKSLTRVAEAEAEAEAVERYDKDLSPSVRSNDWFTICYRRSHTVMRGRFCTGM